MTLLLVNSGSLATSSTAATPMDTDSSGPLTPPAVATHGSNDVAAAATGRSGAHSMSTPTRSAGRRSRSNSLSSSRRTGASSSPSPSGRSMGSASRRVRRTRSTSRAAATPYAASTPERHSSQLHRTAATASDALDMPVTMGGDDDTQGGDEMPQLSPRHRRSNHSLFDGMCATACSAPRGQHHMASKSDGIVPPHLLPMDADNAIYNNCNDGDEQACAGGHNHGNSHNHHLSYLSHNRGSTSSSTSADDASLHSLSHRHDRQRSGARKKHSKPSVLLASALGPAACTTAAPVAAGRKLSAWTRKLPKLFQRQRSNGDEADGSSSNDGDSDSVGSSGGLAGDNSSKVGQRRKTMDVDSHRSPTPPSGSTSPSAQRKLSLPSLRSPTAAKNLGARSFGSMHALAASQQSSPPIKSPSRGGIFSLGNNSTEFHDAVRHLKPPASPKVSILPVPQQQPLSVPMSPGGGGPGTTKTIIVHQSLSNLSSPVDSSTSSHPMHNEGTTSFSLDASGVPAASIPALIMPKAARRNSAENLFSVPLRHASTVDAPWFGPRDLGMKSGRRITSLFQGGNGSGSSSSKKIDFNLLKKTKSMEPSRNTPPRFGRTTSVDADGSHAVATEPSNNNNHYASFMGGAAGRSTTAPVNLAGFQQIPLERFKTIEPESGAMRTSMSYRINRQQMFQEHLTIHAFDGHGKKMVQRLAGLGAVQHNPPHVDNNSSSNNNTSPGGLDSVQETSDDMRTSTEVDIDMAVDFRQQQPGVGAPTSTHSMQYPPSWSSRILSAAGSSSTSSGRDQSSASSAALASLFGQTSSETSYSSSHPRCDFPTTNSNK